MKLLLADDHVLIIDTLRAYWHGAEDGVRLIAANDLAGVTKILDKETVDLVLLDLHMPGMDGLNGLEYLRKTYPRIPVALFTGTAGIDDIRKAMRLGAAGYLPKTLPVVMLDEAIARIIKGERFVALDYNNAEIFPSCYGDTVRTGSEQAGNAKDIGLTRREKDVLACLLQGQANKDIAEALGIEVVTVKLHVRGVCRKLGAKNRTQAALMARSMGL